MYRILIKLIPRNLFISENLINNKDEFKSLIDPNFNLPLHFSFVENHKLSGDIVKNNFIFNLYIYNERLTLFSGSYVVFDKPKDNLNFAEFFNYENILNENPYISYIIINILQPEENEISENEINNEYLFGNHYYKNYLKFKYIVYNIKLNLKPLKREFLIFVQNIVKYFTIYHFLLIIQMNNYIKRDFYVNIVFNYYAQQRYNTGSEEVGYYYFIYIGNIFNKIHYFKIFNKYGLLRLFNCNRINFFKNVVDLLFNFIIYFLIVIFRYNFGDRIFYLTLNQLENYIFKLKPSFFYLLIENENYDIIRIDNKIKKLFKQVIETQIKENKEKQKKYLTIISISIAIIIFIIKEWILQ